MKTTVFNASAALAVLLLCASCGKPSKPVAQVEGKWISQPQWRAFLDDRGLSVHSPKAQLDDALKRLVRREVAVVLARRKGLLDDKEWERRKGAIDDMAAEKAYLLSLADKEPKPTDAQLEAAFKQDQETRDLRIIAARSQENARKARAALDAHEPFEKVANQWGEKASNLPPDGRLKGMHQSQLSPEVSGAAFKAKPGDVIGPLQAGQGFMVALVEAASVPSHEDFLKQRDAILLAVQQKAMESEREKAADALKAKYPARVDESVLRLLSDQKAKPGDEDKTAATIGGEKITLGMVAGRLEAESRRAGKEIPPDIQTLQAVIEALAGEARIVAEAKALGFNKKEEAKAMAWDASQEMAARMFVESYVSGLLVPDETLQQYYNANKERFRVPDRIHARYLFSDSPKPLAEAVRAASAGTPWEQILKMPGLLPETRSGDLGWASTDDLSRALPPEIVRQLDLLSPGQWMSAQAGPGRFVALQMVDVQRGGLPAFAQIKDAVRSAYLQENGPKLAFDYLDGPGRQGIAVKEFPENAVAP